METHDEISPLSPPTERELREMTPEALAAQRELHRPIGGDELPEHMGPVAPDEAPADDLPAPGADEIDDVEDGLADVVSDLADRVAKIEGGSTHPLADQLADQLLYRVLFLESALTIFYEELRARRIVPHGPGASDEWIERIENLARSRAKRHVTAGRGEMIAANLSATREPTDDDDFRT